MFQHHDLYVTLQIFANNQPLCMPIRTSYKYIEKPPWSWEEWITLPLRIKDLTRNSQLAITVWDIESPQQGDVPVCGATISLFDRNGEFRQGLNELRLWPNKAADGNTKTTTPGFITDHKENEFDEYFNSNNKNNNIGISNLSNYSYSFQENTFNSKINNNTNNNNNIGNSNSNTQLSNTTNYMDEFPILDELDRLAKVFI